MPRSNSWKERSAACLREAVGIVVDSVASRIQQAEQEYARSQGDRVLQGFGRCIQLDNYSCAVSCTVAVLRYYGFSESAGTTRRQLRTSRSGTDRAAIVRVLEEHGLTCRQFESGRRDTLRRAINTGAPVIVEVDGDHVVVVYGYGSENVYVADSAPNRRPRVILSWVKFVTDWDRAGVVVKRG
jgi:ABC-type bacteriocin/lantibiotic exporter with double-glycine peptidase domain